MRFYSHTEDKKVKLLSLIVFEWLLISQFISPLLELLFSFTDSALFYRVRVDFTGLDYSKEPRPEIDGVYSANSRNTEIAHLKRQGKPSQLATCQEIARLTVGRLEGGRSVVGSALKRSTLGPGKNLAGASSESALC